MISAELLYQRLVDFFIGLAACLVIFLSFKVYNFYLEVDKYQKGYVQSTYDERTKTVSYQSIKDRPENWVSFNEISLEAMKAIQISEDWAFFEHQGMDWNQVLKASVDALETGKAPRGASTITQQLVKNLFLTSERSLKRKFREMFVSYFVDGLYGKRRILEIYLNIIEYGEGLYGIEKASSYYFSKRPIDLTAKEGAFLAMLLPNPKLYSSSFRNNEVSFYARETINSILNKLVIAKVITLEERLALQKQKFVFEN